MIVLLAAAVAALVLDQGTKRAVTSGRAEVRLVHNRRGALLVLRPRWAALVLGVVGTLAAVVAQAAGPITAIGLGLLVGGAGGNLVDRARQGAVVDFVSVGPWPVFNVADAAMVVGIAVAVMGLL